MLPSRLDTPAHTEVKPHSTRLLLQVEDVNVGESKLIKWSVPDVPEHLKLENEELQHVSGHVKEGQLCSFAGLCEAMC